MNNNQRQRFQRLNKENGINAGKNFTHAVSEEIKKSITELLRMQIDTPTTAADFLKQIDKCRETYSEINGTEGLQKLDEYLLETREKITKVLERHRVEIKAAAIISRYWRFRFKHNTLWIIVKAVVDTGFFTMEQNAKLR